MGLPNLSGDHWKHVRSKITPAFSTGKLRKMATLVDHSSDTLLTSLRRNLKKGSGTVELMEIYGAYTMDVICSTAFGIQIDSQSNPNDEFVVNARKFLILKLFSPLILILIFLPKLHFLAPLFGFSFLDKDIQLFFRRITSKLLSERVVGSKDRVDFLQLMKNAQHESEDSDAENDEEQDDNNSVKTSATSSWTRKGITFDEILGNAEVFFFAGYETTTITLSMASYYLALYPEYQDKLRQEITDKVGSSDLSYDNVREVEYLEMIINETLRISPPATRTDRVCINDTVINGVQIPAGMNISVPIYGIHHDPDNWEDPDKFIPERFAKSYDPMTFLPFGYGPRICIGMRLVQMELKMCLAKVIRNFRISVCSETQIPPEMLKLGLLKPQNVKLRREEIK